MRAYQSWWKFFGDSFACQVLSKKKVEKALVSELKSLEPGDDESFLPILAWGTVRVGVVVPVEAGFFCIASLIAFAIADDE